MTEPTTVHHQTKRALDLAIAKRLISRESYDAVLAGKIDLQQAKELGRSGTPTDTSGTDSGLGSATGTSGAGSPQDSPDAPPQPTSRISKSDRTRECIACGGLTKGGRFHPGCDAKMHRMTREYVLGERELDDEQLEYVEQSGKLEQAKARIETEERRRREKIARKTERQRQREGEAEAKKRNRQK